MYQKQIKTKQQNNNNKNISKMELIAYNMTIQTRNELEHVQ